MLLWYKKNVLKNRALLASDFKLVICVGIKESLIVRLVLKKMEQKKISGCYHLGHVLMECFLKRPNSLCQLDGETGKKETNASVLSRSIRLARAMRRIGLQPGDVLALGGRNHLDLHIPFYAAIFNGLPICGVDPYFKYDEVKALFQITKPKIAFCQEDSYDVYKKAADDIGLEMQLVTFDGRNNMTEFVQKYSEVAEDDEFKPAAFDADKIYLFLISTSGTSGTLKVAAIKHEIFYKKGLTFASMQRIPIDVTMMALNLSPIQWVTGVFNAVGLPLMSFCKLMTSKSEDLDHIIDIINTYKPVTTLLSSSLMSQLMSRKDDVDLTCFRVINLTGAKIYQDVLDELRSRLDKKAVIVEAYGMTETLGPVLKSIPNGPAGCCGKPMDMYELKLVDPDTGEEINKPNVTGELWTKGIGFTEYYMNPEATANAFTEDGFYKTGDLLYRDDEGCYYYVERLKMLIKYRSNHIIPTELEDVIRRHPSVKEVCVTSVPHTVDGQLPVACVTLRDGMTVTAQEIKDLVAGKLAKHKQLCGGVVFLEEMPMTSSGKLARGKIRQLVLEAKRQ